MRSVGVGRCGCRAFAGYRLHRYSCASVGYIDNPTTTERPERADEEQAR